MKKTLLAASIMSLCTPLSFSYAAEAVSSTNKANSETMVVTASRFEQPQTKVLASTSVITQKDIQTYQDKSLTDVFRRVPGIEITQNGGRGQSASIFMRGTNSNQTLILIDGVRVSSAVGGVGFNNIPVSAIERIEIIRGPGAAMYGSDAIGGVINIITRSEHGEVNRTVSIGVGSHNEKEANVSITDDIGEDGHLKIAANSEKTDGYDFKEQQDGTNYGYDSQNGLIGYDHQFNDYWNLYTSASWFESTGAYDSYGAKNEVYSRNYSFTGKANYHRNDWQSFILVNHQDTKNIDYAVASGTNAPSSLSEIDLTSVQWANLYQFNQYLRLGGGVDWRRESLDDSSVFYGSPNVLAGEHRDTSGIYASVLTTQGRFSVEANIRNDRHDQYDNYTTWSLASGYQIDDYHHARVSYGTAYRAPSYSDLLTSPDLQPEKSRNIEIGLSGNYSFLSWDVSAYDNDVDNLITWYSDSNGNICSTVSYGGCSLNTDARIKGVELAIGFNTWFIHHTVVAEYKDHKDDNGVQLARRAKQNYKWIGDVILGDFDLSATYLYTGKRLDLPVANPASDDYLDAYGLWNLTVGYWLTPVWEVKAKIDNVLDKEYETAKGYRADERTYYVSTSYQF